MADKDAKETKETKEVKDAAEKPKGGKRKLVIIAAIVAVVLVGVGVGAWLMLGEKTEAVAEPKPEPKKAPVFVELDMFTVNLHKDAGDDVERFMQVKLVAEVKDAPTGEVIKKMMPAVRSEILLLLGSKRAEDLASREGKEKLAGEIVLAANKSLERTPAEKGVEGVNFTHIIVQ